MTGHTMSHRACVSFQIVGLTFEEVRLQSCNYGSIRVRDERQNLLYTFCSSEFSPPVITSGSTQISVSFDPTNRPSTVGFRARWNSYARKELEYKPYMNICNTAEMNEKTKCGFIMACKLLFPHSRCECV